MPGARRAVKLSYTEKNIRCPYCKAQLVIGTVMGTILMSRRNCPNCSQEFLIENDLPRKLGGDLKKPSGSEKPVRATKRAQLR
jgi:ssDNA-binding Zn-finger/Zn-ribbon topoisomerase 1